MLPHVFPRLCRSLVPALEGLTKAVVGQALVPFQPVLLVGQWFRVTLHYNIGVVFGLSAHSGPWLIWLSGLRIVGLAAWLVRALSTGTFPLAASWPVGLLLGGALGNFADRVQDGRVTDFLDVGLGATRWPIFNLADRCIVLGLLMLLVAVHGKTPALGDTSCPR